MISQVLFPEIESYCSGMLSVGDGHELYWECSGNADGVPVLVLHGGPGAGCSPKVRRLFDPEFYRIIMFDQRGAGKSTPHASIEFNTTEHLVADIEKLREYLGVEGWLILGGSWGATLALVYASLHPKSCLGLVLRGTWLGRKADIDHFMTGMGGHRPKAYEAFVRHVGLDSQTATSDEIMRAYAERLYHKFSDSNGATGYDIAAAKAWFAYEDAFATFEPDESSDEEDDDNMLVALAMARLELHYFLNNAFLSEGYILDIAASVLTDYEIFGVLLHGKHDWICPHDGVMKLAESWPQAHLIFANDSGHSRWEYSLLQFIINTFEVLKYLI